jgi:lysophospholipase L1-like esterase
VVKAATLSKRSDLLLKVAMAVISPLLILGLLEGVAYVWEQGQAKGPYAWELVASRRMVWEKHTEPGAGYTLIKPNSHYEWQGIPVDINSHGLRGPETAFTKPPGTFRVLNLGDSVAMGWGVREDETYGRRLEQMLNKQGTGGPRYEVINAGVPGWNQANELAYLQAIGLKYKPDLVLVDVTLANDVYGKSALLLDNYSAPIRWLRDNTYFWSFLTVQFRWLEARAQGQARIDVLNPPTDPSKYFPVDPESARWTEFWGQVLTIHKLATDNNAEFVLILFPLEFQVLDESYPTLPQDLLTAKSAEAGITVVDMLPAFRRACQQKPGGACQLEDRYLFADVWMHPSAYGHELTADAVQAVLADKR